MHTHASRQAGKQASRQAGKQASRQAGKQASRQAGKQASRQAGKQASRQAGKQARTHGRIFNSATFTDVSTFTDDTPALKRLRLNNGVALLRYMRNNIVMVCTHFAATKTTECFHSIPWNSPNQLLTMSPFFIMCTTLAHYKQST